MKRGDIVIVAVPGDYGKPRPAVVVQADAFSLPSLTIVPVTSELHDTPLLRIAVEPTGENGLQKPSQIMIDKVLTISRSKVAQRVGGARPGHNAAREPGACRFSRIVGNMAGPWP